MLGGVIDGLFGITKALDDGGDEGGVEVELEVVGRARRQSPELGARLGRL